MKVLITGGRGFIGKNLYNLIKKKYQVSILTRNKDFGKEEIMGDLKNYKETLNALKKIDVVVHLAFSKKYNENILMTKNLIKAAKNHKIKKIVLLSSMSAKREFPDEYGKTKQKIEKMVKNSDVSYTILRPSIIYGKGSTSFDFMIDYIKKIPFFTPIIGSGRYRLSPVHIKDVIWCIDKCIKNKKTDRKSYDIVGGERVYFIDLVNELKKEIGIKKRNIRVPLFFCRIVTIIFPKIISKENLINLTQDSIADLEQAKKDLNYKPISFKVGRKNGLI